MSRVPAAADQGSGRRDRRPDRRRPRRYDTTKMYPTEQLRLEPRLREGLDRRPYASLRAQIAAKRAATGTTGSVRREARGRSDRGSGGLSLAACGGGGDQPGATDNACGFRDGEPNGSAGQATVVQPGATFDGCLEASDVDFLSLRRRTTRLAATCRGPSPAMGTVRATIYDGAGQAELDVVRRRCSGRGATFYWASGSSQETRIAHPRRRGGGAPYTYQLTPAYTPVDDAYEPNDAMDAARRCRTGDRCLRICSRPARCRRTSAAYDDYYRFTAQPGALSIRLDDVPADVAARCSCFGTDGSEVARVSTACAAPRWR